MTTFRLSSLLVARVIQEPFLSVELALSGKPFTETLPNCTTPVVLPVSVHVIVLSFYLDALRSTSC